METNLKKLFSIFGLVCFSIASVNAQADNGDNCCNIGCIKTREIPKPPARSAVPPCKYINGDDSPSIMVSADYTLWTARQTGLAYAVSGFNPCFDGSICCGNVCFPKSKLRSGFKVDLGMFLCHDCWDVVATYTWFYNKRNRFHQCCFPEGSGYSTWAVDPLVTCCDSSTACPAANANNGFDCNRVRTQVLDQACGRFSNWFNRVDVTLGRNYYAGHYHTLRVFLGLLGAWDKQWFDINYLGRCRNVNDWSLWRNEQKWWGVGPYFGVSPAFIFPQWCGDSQWSIFLDSGFALPWSKANATMRMFRTPNITTSGTSVTTANACCCNDNSCGSCCGRETSCCPSSNDCCDSECPCVEPSCDSSMPICYNLTYWNIMPMMELALGLRWETWLECNWNFLLQAAWETQVYFDHNWMFSMGDNPRSNGNYTMQGLTIKAVIGF